MDEIRPTLLKRWTVSLNKRKLDLDKLENLLTTFSSKENTKFLKLLEEDINNLRPILNGNNVFDIYSIGAKRFQRIIPVDGEDLTFEGLYLDRLFEISKYYPMEGQKLLFTTEYSLYSLLKILFDVTEDEYTSVISGGLIDSQVLLSKRNVNLIKLNKLKDLNDNIKFFLMSLENTCSGNIFIGYQGEAYNVSQIASQDGKIAFCFYLLLMSLSRYITDYIYNYLQKEFNEYPNIRLFTHSSLGLLYTGELNRYKDKLIQPIPIPIKGWDVKAAFNFYDNEYISHISFDKYLEVRKL